jgi:Dna[CI] antecedent, DciA
MPKKVPRNNPAGGSHRTVQSAVSLLQRISRAAGGALPVPQMAPPAALEQLRQLLPEELRPHLREVLEKPGELVLFTDSAVWAGRLRLALPGLAGFAAGRRQVVRLMPRGGYRR